jgi:hypothetical protein
VCVTCFLSRFLSHTYKGGGGKDGSAGNNRRHHDGGCDRRLGRETIHVEGVADGGGPDGLHAQRLAVVGLALQDDLSQVHLAGCLELQAPARWEVGQALQGAVGDLRHALKRRRLHQVDDILKGSTKHKGSQNEDNERTRKGTEQ